MIGGHFTGKISMKCILLAAVVVVAMTTPALAKHCPNDVKIIDQSLPKAMGLNETQMTEIKALRDKGAALHKSGDHAESIKALHEAVKMLGVEPYKP